MATVPMRVGAHGGKRQGAGRPRKIEGAVRRSFVLRQDQIDWLEANALDQEVNASDILRVLIDQHRAEHTLKLKPRLRSANA